jgi:hypothetical protein
MGGYIEGRRRPAMVRGTAGAQLRLVRSLGGACPFCLRSVRVCRLAVAGKAGTR